MEKLIHRQNMTMDYLPSEGLSADSPCKSSEEMDFNDVFGGPPRRFSMQEMRVRRSFSPERVESEDERLSSSPWNSEKPVFGEESNSSSTTSAVRRRQLQQSDDFYGDIFGGDDSSYKSPRRIDRDRDDVFGSSPSGGSRIASPSKPSPSKDEAFSVSLPPQLFSLPAKLTKAAEFPAFGSRNHTSSSLSRFSNQGNRDSPLSHRSSTGCSITEEEDSPSSPDDHRCVGSEKESRNIADGNNSEDQFHFSIYKWAGRDVPVLIPLSSGKSRKEKGKFDGFARDEVQSFDVEVEKNVSTGQEKIHESEMSAEELPVEEAIEKTNEVKILDAIVKEEASSASLKSRVKALRSFLTDDAESPGNAAGVKENKAGRASKVYVKSTKKIETDPKGDENVDRAVLKGDKKSGVKGKIRDFVQKFNQEAADSSIKSDDVQTGSRSFRWKAVSVQQKENKPGVDISKAEEKLSSKNHEKDQKDVAFKVEEKAEAKQYTDTKAPSYRTSHSSTDQKNEFSSDPLHRDSKASMENFDDPLDCNFLVQELSDDHQKNTRNDESSDDIKALDAKIHQWSVGKKGNIRSLLSTLQYVLWQGSGWQPIALVDLIESNSVKRAYQKALLRLHPDKLQQKGAATDHKYIAEKVFDILQEAWDHFNTLGL